MMEHEPLAVISEVVAALERLGIGYVIGGSFASSVHGVPRATNDVDLVADVRYEHVEAVVAALRDEFYIDRTAVRRAIEHGSSFNLIHYGTVFKVDVFVQGADGFRRAQLARGNTITVRGRSLRVLSPEDTVLAKLHWYREGGGVSERQWRDVLAVIAVQGEALDLEYLRQAADGMSLGELLARALSEGQVGA